MMWVAARGCCELSIEMGGPLRLPANPPLIHVAPDNRASHHPLVSQTFSFTLRVTPVINYLSAEPVDA